MLRAGILSDTHLHQVSKQMENLFDKAFRQCDVILHAGDITHPAVLDVFRGRVFYAVHGNMCVGTLQRTLPSSRKIELNGYTIGLCHGAGPRHNIEERMWTLFPEADCIVYGHTHQPVCHRHGDTLFINPGSFQCTSAHGAPASFAILTIDDSGLHGSLHTLSSGA